MGSLHTQFLKALMEKYPHSGLTSALENLPEEFAQKFRTLPESKIGLSPEVFFPAPSILLDNLHPSWHEELIELCPKALQPTLQTIMPPSGQKKKKAEISEPLRTFLLSYALKKWPEGGALRPEFIEESPLRWLATCYEPTMSSLISLLGVYDVVDIVRQIVDKKVLQKIFAPLTPLQQRYIRSLLHRPPRSPVLNKALTALLASDPAKGAEQLRERGYEQLGYALKGAPDLLVWHVLHHIDREKALLLKKSIDKKIIAAKQAEAIKLLDHAYEFLKKGQKS